MRQFKKSLIILLAAALVFVCLGCSDIVSYFEHQFSLPEDSVRFYTEGEEEKLLLTVEEIMAYESAYANCNGSWFRDQLKGEDLCIYNAYLYAMEHSYSGFELYVADKDKDFYFIRDALSLDSPFLEQNYNNDGESCVLWSANHIGERVHFKIGHFTQEAWQRKLEALDKCEKIVAGIPEDCASAEEKMFYLFNYVCDNIEYTEYENLSAQEYLYDAVIKGKTNCDGYSNMLSLLFNLIGVEACEAMGDNVLDDQQETSDEDDVGHTWVVAKLGNVFYNFDPTYEDSSSTEEGETAGLYFSFSDTMVDMKYIDCDDMRPKCTDTTRDFDYAHIVIDDTEKASIKKVAKLTDSRIKQGETETLLVIKKVLSDREFDDFLDSYINKTKKISKVSASMVTVNDSFTSMKLRATPW